MVRGWPASSARGRRTAALLAAAGAVALGAVEAQAANLPTQTTTTAAGEDSPTAFAGTKYLYGKSLVKGAPVPKGSAVVALTASVPPGRNNITGTCPARTGVYGLGTPTSADVQDLLGKSSRRTITIEVANRKATVQFTDYVLCVNAPSASVKFSAGGATSPITFPASDTVSNPPKKGAKLRSNQLLVTIRTGGLRAGVTAQIPVTCRRASFSPYPKVQLAAAQGLTVRPGGDSVIVRAPTPTPSGTQTIYAVCQA
jgi:hypothetical protein